MISIGVLLGWTLGTAALTTEPTVVRIADFEGASYGYWKVADWRR